MPNPLALLGESVKALTPAIVPRLSFGTSNGITRHAIPAFWPNGLTQNFGGTGPSADYDFNALLADPLQNSVIAACVDTITRAISEAPLVLENLKGKEWVRVESHEALDVFNANPDLSESEIWGVTAGYKATRGIGYWVVFFNQAGTKPTEIWPWQPERVRLAPNGDKSQFIAGYEVQQEDGEWKPLSRQQVIHFRHLPNMANLRGGWSPLSAGQSHMVGDNAISTYHAAILLNAGVMSLLISIKQGVAQGAAINVTPDQFQAFLDALRRKYIGNKAAAGGIDGLNIPLEIQKMAYSPDEMATPELAQFYMQRLHALIGVSPMVTDLGKDPTYLNKAEAINDFWERRIVPDRNKDAATLNRQLLPLFGLDNAQWRYRFDFSGVAALQENTDQLFMRWNEVWKSGGVDRYTLQTKIGLADVPDDYKGQFAAAAPAETIEAPETKAAPSRGWQTQPRDDLGRWTDGAGNLIASHVSAVMHAEGIHESRHGDVLGKVASGEHKTRADVLAHIDAITSVRGYMTQKKGLGTQANFADDEARTRLSPMLSAIEGVHAPYDNQGFDVHGAGAIPGALADYQLSGGHVRVNLKESGAPLLDFVHEMGHRFDHHALGDPKSDQGESMGSNGDSLSPELQGVFNAIWETETYKKLRSGRTMITYRNYLMARDELFARTYAQYIAHRSNHPQLKSEIAGRRERSGKMPTQWKDNEFEPVVAAMDKLMASKGLLK